MMPASNLNLYAKFTANINTPYKVEHYQESLAGDYVLIEVENLTGTTDTLVQSLAKEYTGFSENTTLKDRIVSGKLSGDGSLALSRYYDRNEYTFTYFDWDLSIYYAQKVSYDEKVILPSDPVRNGYSFEGWNETFDIAKNNQDIYAMYLKNPTTLVENKGKEIELTVSGLENAISYTKEEREEEAISKLEIEILDMVDVSDIDRNLLDDYLNDSIAFPEYKQIILDITLFKIVGDKKEAHSQANQDITVTFHLPDEYKGSEFEVLRIHDGVVESLDYTYDESLSVVTFKTNKFSIYTLVFEDETEKIEDMSDLSHPNMAYWLFSLGIIMLLITFKRKSHKTMNY